MVSPEQVPSVRSYITPEPQKELELVRLLTDSGLASFQKDIGRSGGSCIIPVHPFFEIITLEQKGYEPNDDLLGFIDLSDNYSQYVTRLTRMLKHAVEPGGDHERTSGHPPVVMLTEMTNDAYDNEPARQDTEDRLTRHLGQYTGIREGHLYTVFTRLLTPSPAESFEHIASLFALPTSTLQTIPRCRPSQKRLFALALGLRSIGVTKVVVAGEWLEFLPYSRIHRTLNRFRRWDLQKQTIEQQTEKYGEHRNGIPKHPFEQFSPERCVGFTIEAFSFAGIRVGVSTATFPDTVINARQFIRDTRG
jgi:hypothetical protein